MTAMIVLAVLIGLIVLGLQRNHARRWYPDRRPAGDGTKPDRDAERVLVDMSAVSNFRRR